MRQSVIIIRLENKGGVRISARRGKPKPSSFLYDDNWDQCEHAGTLKVRQIKEELSSLVFDWYSLKPFSALIQRAVPTDTPSHVAQVSGCLEQINYLADFQVPQVEHTEVDFWLEPHEIYELKVPTWLPEGVYAIKAYFLGDETEHQEEEYWSCTDFVRLYHDAAAAQPNQVR